MKSKKEIKKELGRMVELDNMWKEDEYSKAVKEVFKTALRIKNKKEREDAMIGYITAAEWVKG